jgi:lipopolysaccharide heptosyltransferase II
MRWIDRWIGVPTCYVLTVVDRILRARTNPEPAQPRRILFIGLAEIGAMVVAHPALVRARKLFEGCEIFFLTFAAGQGMLELIGIDPQHQIIVRPNSPRTFLLDAFAAIIRIRRQRFDATVNLEVYSRFSTLVAYLSGARLRAGFHGFLETGSYVGDLVTHRVIYSPHLHISQAYLTLVEALTESASDQPRVRRPIVGDAPTPRFRLAGDEHRRDAALVRLRNEYGRLTASDKIVILNANASDLIPTRRWALENFVELGRRLLLEKDVVIALTGTASEREVTDTVAQRLQSDRVVNLAGKTTLRELIDLYNISDLLITNDSGPAHFVSMTDLPAIVLYGPETPDIFGPLAPTVETVWLRLPCSPCISVYNQKRSPCADNQCLKRITVDDIFDRAKVHLRQDMPRASAAHRPALVLD